MFRDSSVNARRGFGKPFQASRLIDVDDSLSGPPPNTEFKAQPYGATTKLFANAYKLDEAGAKFVGGSTAYPRKPVSEIAEWAKAESDLAYMTAFYNRAISAESANKILVSTFTPQSYLPPASISQAATTIEQAMNVIRPPVVNPVQEPVTQPPSTQPPGTLPPVVQPGTQPPTTVPPTTQPPTTVPPTTQPPTTVPPTTQPPTTVPPGTLPPVVQPPVVVPAVVTPGAQPPATGPGDLTPALPNPQDDALVTQLKQIVPTQGFSQWIVLNSYSGGNPSFALAVPPGVAVYGDALVSRVNVKVFQNSNPEAARSFVATMLSGGFVELFINESADLANTSQFSTVITALNGSYPGMANIPQLSNAAYLMTVFYLLQDTLLNIPTPEELKSAFDRSVLFLRFGIKHMCAFIITIMAQGSQLAVVPSSEPRDIMAENITGMQRELNSDVLYNETRGLTAEQYAYGRDPKWSYSDIVNGEVRGLVYDFRVKQSPPILTLPNGTDSFLNMTYVIADKVAELVTAPIGIESFSFLAGLAVPSIVDFFRRISLGKVLAGAFIFRALLPYAQSYSVEIATGMLANIVAFQILSALSTGFLRAVTDVTMLMNIIPGSRVAGPTGFSAIPVTVRTQALELATTSFTSGLIASSSDLIASTIAQEQIVRVTAELIARTIFHMQNVPYPTPGGAATALFSERFLQYKNAEELIANIRAPIQRNRVALSAATSALLTSFGLDAGSVADVIRKMTVGTKFKFRESGAINVPSQDLFEILADDLGYAKKSIVDFIEAYYSSVVFADTKVTAADARLEAVRGWIFRLGLRDTITQTKKNWAELLSTMYGVRLAMILILINSIAAEPDTGEDASTQPAGPVQPTGPIIASTGDGSRPGEEGTAVAVSIPTPQYTDAPPSITMESALELLADNTNSVDQIVRSNAPARFIWTLTKYRRKSIRALWYAVFVGLGIPAADATQALNFLDPTFVDASKDTNSYSGIRTNGAHGIYPRLDAFFVRNRNAINKDFASRSSSIRAKYAAVFFSRFFGLRGKYYAKDLFALSTAELSQAAQLSRIAIDVLTMDSTHQDGQPPDQMPTAAEMRGYRTGPVDFTGYL